MKVLIIDGQGGGVGRSLAEKLREALGDEAALVALGANAAATANILRGGAKTGATGENAIRVNCRGCAAQDIIVGPLGILMADAIMGEITPAVALAVARSAARKVLVPATRCNTVVAGVQDMPLAKYIEETVRIVQGLWS